MAPIAIALIDEYYYSVRVMIGYLTWWGLGMGNISNINMIRIYLINAYVCAWLIKIYTNLIKPYHFEDFASIASISHRKAFASIGLEDLKFLFNLKHLKTISIISRGKKVLHRKILSLKYIVLQTETFCCFRIFSISFIKKRTTLFLRQSLEIGGSWSKDFCVYLHKINYIEFYNKIINN